MKITFVRTPFYNLVGVFNWVYPLGIGYLSAVMKEAGHETVLVDGDGKQYEDEAMGMMGRAYYKAFPSKSFQKGFNNLERVHKDRENEVWKRLVDDIENTAPDIICFSCFTQNLSSVRLLSSLLKKRLKDVPIAVGGIHPSSAPLESMNDLPDVDFIVTGEGEYTLKELCDCISSGSERAALSTIKGLGFRDGGEVVLNGPREPIKDLDSLPLPDRTLSRQKEFEGAHTIFTSRGCPFNCSFCASKVLWTRAVRYRSIERVMQELKHLAEDMGAWRIRIADDTFTLSKKRVMEFCDLFEKAGLKEKIKSLSLGSRVDTIDEEIIERLVSINVNNISFGIESGSPRILSEISKGITPEKVEQTMALVTKHKIMALCFFMVGHPGETVEDVEASIRLASRISNRFIRTEVNIVSPYPATPLWDIAVAKGWKLDPDEYYRMFHQGTFVVNISGMTDSELLSSYRRFSDMSARHVLKMRMNHALGLLKKGDLGTLAKHLFK